MGRMKFKVRLLDDENIHMSYDVIVRVVLRASS